MVHRLNSEGIVSKKTSPPTPRRDPMNRNLASTPDPRWLSSTANRIAAWLMLITAIALVLTFFATAQDSALQAKLTAVTQAMTENTQKLHAYRWIETTQPTPKGEQK